MTLVIYCWVGQYPYCLSPDMHSQVNIERF